jgi:glycosyltransferase involved in cell wall biosynthesis
VKSETYTNSDGETYFYKGFQFVSEAVFELNRQGYPVEHQIVGDGDARMILENWITDNGYGSVSKCLGRLSDEELDLVFAKATIFAMASEREGFGLVYVEAMAHGLPCVCVDVGASKEVVKHEEVGLVAKARDSQSLVDAIRRLIQDRKLYERLSSTAKSRAQTIFSNKMFKDRLIAAFDLVEKH